MPAKVQMQSIVESDSGVARVSFSFQHEGLPLRIYDEYKDKEGQWRSSEQCEVIGANMVVVKYARIFDGNDGLWVAHSLRIPQDVQAVVCDAVRKRLGLTDTSEN